MDFDFEVGWATSHDNFHQRRNPLQQVVQVATVITVGNLTFGAVSAWAGASSGLGLGLGSTASIVVGSAAAGAVSSFVGGALNGKSA